MIKKFIPAPAKKIARKMIKQVKYTYRSYAIQKPINDNQQIKIILGAAETFQPGWYSTNEQWLDIANATHWRKIFKGKKVITHAVAEHVFEHLTHDECKTALQLLAQHMAPGGRIRIAVPDGYNPNPEYIRHVGICGIGDDAADHKQLLNVDVLSALLTDAGFAPTHIEGYTSTGVLVQTPYSAHDGLVRRSRAYTAGHKIGDKPWAFPDSETSLIVDGIKI